MKHILAIFCVVLSANVYAQAPSIDYFNPTYWARDTAVTIWGSNFTGATSVRFGNTEAVSFVVDSATTITAIAAEGSAGDITVTTPLGTATAPDFNLPHIDGFTPLSAGNGSLVNIFGYNFFGSSAVSFGGIPADSFFIVNNFTITARVGKANSGEIKVTSLPGTATKGGFYYTGIPTIKTISPLSGPVNTIITITGTGFDTSLAGNIVLFGGARGQVTEVTPNSLKVKVPYGAGFQPISVTVHKYTVYANQPFYLTWTNNGLPINSSSFAFHPNGSNFEQFTVADFDGDNKPDIACGNSYLPNVFFYKNNTTGETPVFTQDNGLSLSEKSLASGDLNGDGKPEVIVGTTSGVTVCVNNSTSNGFNFISNTSFSTGDYVRSIAINDFDGDGRPDLAVANFNSNTVTVLRNGCGGCTMPSYSNKINLATGKGPYTISSGDIDGDGLADVIVTVQDSNQVSVFRNTTTVVGQISFAPRINYETTNLPRGLAVVDMDKDGKLDMVVTSVEGIASTYKNTSTPGNIAFLPRTDQSTGPNALHLSAGDIDGDASPDLVLSKFYYDTLSVMKNISSPGSISVADHFDYTYPYFSSTTTAITDINQDGKADIITSTGILRNKIDVPPTITGFAPTTVYATDTLRIRGSNLTGATAVSIGGIPAIFYKLAADSLILAIPGFGTTGEVSVTTPYGTSSKTGLKIYAAPSISSVEPLTGPIGSVVEIKGQYFDPLPANNIVYFGPVKAELISATDNSIKVKVPVGASYSPVIVTIPSRKLTVRAGLPFIVSFPGAGSNFNEASFATKKDYTCDTLTMNTLQADFDNDGKPDLLLGETDFYGNHFSTYRNNSTPGNIALDPEQDHEARYGPHRYNVCDMNGDGKLDILAANLADGYIINIFRNLTNSSSLSFDTSMYYYRQGISGENPVGMDLDGDGRNDIFQTVGNVFAFRTMRKMAGDTSFGPAVHISKNGVFIDLQDMDGDGKADIVVYGTPGIYRNTSTLGNISFAAKTNITGFIAEVSRVGDIDNDGKLDIVYTNLSQNTVGINRNNSTAGNFSFAAATSFSFSNPGQFVLADMDGDGKVDIVLGRRNSDTIAVIKNTSSGGSISFGTPVYYKIGGKANDLMACDVDIDGKLDIVTTNDYPPYGTTNRTFTILRNQVGEAKTLSVCPGAAVNINSNISGASYQWQIDSSSGYKNLTNNATYTGVNTGTLHINSAASSTYGYRYRCLVAGSYSDEFVLNFKDEWTGAVNTAWENPGNWSCNAVPDANTDVILNNGTIIINSDVSIRSLKQQPGVNLTVTTGHTFRILH